MQSAVATNIIAFSSEPRTDSVQALAARALTALDADGVAIALSNGNEIVCEASLGAAPEVGAKLDASSALCGQCLRTATPVIDSRPADGSGPPAYSVVVVPVLEAGQAIGVCVAFSDHENAFSSKAVVTLTHTAQSVAALRAPKADPVTTAAVTADVPKPPAPVDPQVLEEIEQQIALFARAEKRRVRVALAVKVACAAVLLGGMAASFVPDRVSASMAPIFHRFEHSPAPSHSAAGDRASRR